VGGVCAGKELAINIERKIYKYIYIISSKGKWSMADRRNPSGCGGTICVTPFVGLSKYRVNVKCKEMNRKGY